MATTQNPLAARGFASHRDLVDEVVRLKDAGKIDGYAIKAVEGRLIAGVRTGQDWAFLAED